MSRIHNQEYIDRERILNVTIETLLECIVNSYGFHKGFFDKAIGVARELLAKHYDSYNSTPELKGGFIDGVLSSALARGRLEISEKNSDKMEQTTLYDMAVRSDAYYASDDSPNIWERAKKICDLLEPKEVIYRFGVEGHPELRQYLQDIMLRMALPPVGRLGEEVGLLMNVANPEQQQGGGITHAAALAAASSSNKRPLSQQRRLKRGAEEVPAAGGDESLAGRTTRPRLEGSPTAAARVVEARVVGATTERGSVS